MQACKWASRDATKRPTLLANALQTAANTLLAADISHLSANLLRILRSLGIAEAALYMLYVLRIHVDPHIRRCADAIRNLEAQGTA
jgi:hypothetical protein